MNKDNLDIRWIQRFANFQSALEQLKDGVDAFNDRDMSLLEKQGLIQAFKSTHELAWKVLKDYAEYQGNFNIKGSRDAVREGFKYSLINDGNLWMQMIEARNLTSHIYDKHTAEEIVETIVHKYLSEFLELERTMVKLRAESKN